MKIRLWRNQQIDVLRQKNKISRTDQENYFNSIISNEISKTKPQNIILLFCKKNLVLGYGGVTNIDWDLKKGELAFLLDNKYSNKSIDSEYYFPIFLKLIKKLSFDYLNLNKIWSETFSIRPRYIRQLELNSFNHIGLIKRNIKIKDSFYDSFFHECENLKNRKKIKKINFFDSKFGNILISSSSKKIPLITELFNAKNIIDKDIKIIGGDSNNKSLSKYFVDYFWHMPQTNSQNQNEIIRKLKILNIRVIIPTRDGELLFWSNLKKVLKKDNINVLVNSKSKILLCNDKLKFSNFCQKNLILSPSILINNGKNKKYIVKERFESSVLIKKNIVKKNIFKYLDKFHNPFIQEYINGFEISVDIWSDSSNKKNYFITRKRNLINNGESQITEIFNNEKLNRIVIDIINKLKLKGPYMFQFIHYKDNFYLIECNTRIGGASTFSIKKGLDLIFWSLVEIYNLGRTFPINYKVNDSIKKMIRIPFDYYK